MKPGYYWARHAVRGWRIVEVVSGLHSAVLEGGYSVKLREYSEFERVAGPGAQVQLCDSLCRYFQPPERQNGEAWITIYKAGDQWMAELYDSVDGWIAGESEPIAESGGVTIAAALSVLVMPAESV